MPYRGNPSTDTSDAIRLLIGDLSTSTSSELFTDAEIDYFSALKPNAHLAAASALTSILGSTRADSFRSVTTKKVGDLSLTYAGAGQAGSYLTIREKIRQLRMDGVRKVKPYAGGISDSDKRASESDTDRDPPHFRIGQHDHPGLGINSTSTF